MVRKRERGKSLLEQREGTNVSGERVGRRACVMFSRLS
jgi:hypothetical protein